MQLEYIRSEMDGKYNELKIYECPATIFMAAVNHASDNVTVERVQGHRLQDNVSIRFNAGGNEVHPLLLRYNVDIAMSKASFLELQSYWNTHGCYAVFHDKPALKCIAGELDQKLRYKVLDNFGWTLELSIPGPASSGWGYITSPYAGLIDKVEAEIRKTAANH